MSLLMLMVVTNVQHQKFYCTIHVYGSIVKCTYMAEQGSWTQQKCYIPETPLHFHVKPSVTPPRKMTPVHFQVSPETGHQKSQ